MKISQKSFFGGVTFMTHCIIISLYRYLIERYFMVIIVYFSSTVYLAYVYIFSMLIGQ